MTAPISEYDFWKLRSPEDEEPEEADDMYLSDELYERSVDA
jgi:hypothetical protein